MFYVRRIIHTERNVNGNEKDEEEKSALADKICLSNDLRKTSRLRLCCHEFAVASLYLFLFDLYISTHISRRK